MTYTRIKSNLLDGTYCGDWLVIASDTVKALEKFYREYPEHKGNRITVEPFDPERTRRAENPQRNYMTFTNLATVSFKQW